MKKIIKPIVLLGALSIFALYAAPKYSELIRHHALEEIISISPSPTKNTLSTIYVNIWGEHSNRVDRLVKSYVETIESNNWTPIFKTLSDVVKTQKVPVNLNLVAFTPYRETAEEIKLFEMINRKLPETDHKGYSYQFVAGPSLFTEMLDTPIDGRKYRIYLSDDLPIKTQADTDFRLYGVLHELGHVFIYESGLALAMAGMEAEIQCDHFALTVLKDHFNNKDRFNRLVDKVITLRKFAKYDQSPEANKYDFSKEIESYRITH